MHKIPDLLAFGKHCHNCGKWMQRSALRKDDNFNYCECCRLEAIRQLRITKARTLSNLFPKTQTAPDASQNLFDGFQVDNEQLTLIKDSLMTDDVSSDNEKKSCYQSEVILFFRRRGERKHNGGQTSEET
ncbi:hypothetical protein WA026_011059 [Henosepilachna vigintioctopunctata]|uniref:Uncharacterized protein n=1 Tax=Henosepilachna vigintioctopunctata TaxID=420089 RepID=A0AAW1U6U6_9CUCU